MKGGTGPRLARAETVDASDDTEIEGRETDADGTVGRGHRRGSWTRDSDLGGLNGTNRPSPPYSMFPLGL